MRGPQITFIGKRRQGKIIKALSDKHAWKGRRGPMRISIYKPDQLGIEGQSIAFKATLFYSHAYGIAHTVVEAIEKLEEWYRERTMQNDPRLQNRDRDSGRRQHGRRRDDGTPRTAETSRASKQRPPRAKARGRKADTE